MPRTPRNAPAGMVFHVLNRGNNRQGIFDKDADYRAFIRLLAQTQESVPMRVLAYCLMPNHWHFLLQPLSDGDLPTFMQKLTTTHVRRWRLHRQNVGAGHLYQGTYKSFPVQNDDHLLVVCRYIERNPLRSNWVRRAEDWRWCSLNQRLDPSSFGLPPNDMPSLTSWPITAPVDYQLWVNQPQTDRELDALHASVNHGRPFGSRDWQIQIAKSLGLESTLHSRGRPKRGISPIMGDNTL